MSVPIHRDPVQYVTAQQAKELDELFNQPLPIISACNRLQRRTDRAMQREWMKGVGATVLASLLAAGLVWWRMQ